MTTNHSVLLVAYVALSVPLGCASAYWSARTTALALRGISAQAEVQELGRYGARHWATVRTDDGQYFDVNIPAGLTLNVGASAEIVYLKDGAFLRRLPMAELIERISGQFTPRVVEVSGFEDSRWLEVLILTSLTVASMLLAVRSWLRIRRNPTGPGQW